MPAPAMAGAVFNALTQRDRAARPAIDAANADWYWFETLHGLPVFDERGSLGRLDNITINPDTLTCVGLTTQDDKGERFGFPFQKIRRVTRDAESVLLELMPVPPYSVERVKQDVARD